MSAHKMSLRNHEVVKQSFPNQIAASPSTNAQDPRNERRGFTLIELMVVIAIIGILIAIGISSYTVLQRGGRDAKRKSDLAVIQSALEQYHADQNNYPVIGNVGVGTVLKSPNGTKTYLNKIPNDSRAGNYSYCYQTLPITPCNNSGIVCTRYELYASLENPPTPVISYTCNARTYNYQVTPP